MKLLLLFTLAAGAVLAQSKGNAQTGKAAFEKFGCWQCHGHEGQGGNAGARLAQTKLSQAGFTNFVRNPPSGGMPPYRAKVLADQELADIFAFVQSLPEAKKNIPLLNP